MAEKDYDGHLLDQLAMLDRLDEVADAQHDDAMKKAIAKERRWVELKLYRKPPISAED